MASGSALTATMSSPENENQSLLDLEVGAEEDTGTENTPDSATQRASSNIVDSDSSTTFGGLEDNHPNGSSNENNRTPPDLDTEDAAEPVDEFQESITTITNRLRCLFACLTLPILPLGFILTLFLLSIIYAAQVNERHHTCSHPLKLYTIWSGFLFLYAPQHKNVKQWLFGYVRERDGPIRPRSVRFYDQCFHLVCLWYVYGGMLLVQDCQDDMILVPQEDGKDDITMSSCEDTCPQLYLATARFVFSLKIFTIVLIMPLVCLPFVYLWIIRRVNSEELLARFGQEEDDGSGGILAKEIMENLREVVLIPMKQEGSHKWKRLGKHEGNKDGNAKMVRIVHKYNSPEQEEDLEKGSQENEGRIRQWLRKKGDEEQELLSSRTSRICEWESVKECCICMCEFDTMSELPPATETDDTDLTITSGDGTTPSEELDTIVQTKCGHLFHKKCIGGWVGGNFGGDEQSAARRNGRAMRRTCPLCREDLAPDTTSTNNESTAAVMA
jgi:hypothetical protein